MSETYFCVLVWVANAYVLAKKDHHIVNLTFLARQLGKVANAWFTVLNLRKAWRYMYKKWRRYRWSTVNYKDYGQITFLSAHFLPLFEVSNIFGKTRLLAKSVWGPKSTNRDNANGHNRLKRVYQTFVWWIETKQVSI